MAGKCQNMAFRKIPRKLKNSGLFEEMLVTSEDFMQVILPAIQKSYLSSESKNRFVYFKYQAVNNELLLEKFQEKRQEMQMGDLAESVAFLCVDNNQQVERICQEGLKTGTGSASYLGHPRLGVHLCRHADVLRPTPLVDGVTYNLIVFKVVKGRVKYVSESHMMDHHPTPGYDCHLSTRSQYTGVSLQNLFQSTQLYLYEYGDDGILKRPRHVCPIAVVQFQYRDGESLEKFRPCQPVSRFPEPALVETLDYVLWSGRMTVKGLFACSVQIMSAQLMTKPVKLGAILNISSKVGMWEGKEKYLSNLTNLTTGKEFYNNDWYINVCEMKPVQPKSNYQKIKHYLASKQCMAVVKLEDYILLIMTDNDVTFQLGLSKDSSESSIHCIFLSKLSRKHKGHTRIQKPKETSERKQSSTAPGLAQIHQNFSHNSSGYLKHMHRINDSYKQMSTNYSSFLSPKHPLARYPDANNNSPIEQPSELMECGSLNHKAQRSFQGQMNASERFIAPDKSLHPPQTDLFEEIDLVESSKSPFPETYSDDMFDRVCQTENSQSGGIEITQQLQLSPGYSSRLAEALSLSSQETEQSLDDLPPLIPWLPVNISESAVTPLSSVADFQPSVTDEELPNQNNVNTHQNHMDNLFGNPDHFISQLNRSQESITPPPTLQIETHDNDSHNNSSSSFSHLPCLECSKISSDLIPGKTISRSQSFEMIVPKREVEDRFDDLDSNIKQICPAASEQTTVGEMPYSSWPRHFMDAFMEPATNNYDHFSTAGSLLPNIGSVRNSELEMPSIRVKTEPQYSPVSCSEENLSPNELVPGNRQFSGLSFIKREPLEVEEFWWQDFPGFRDQPTTPLHRGSSLPNISGKDEPLHEYYIKHPQLHLLLDSGFWPKPPKTSLLEPEQVRNCFVGQANANRPKTLPRAGSLVDLQELSKLYGDRKLEEIPLQSLVDLNKSVEKFLTRKARKSYKQSSTGIEDNSTCIAAKKYKESVSVASGKESVCIPAKRYKEPVAVEGCKKESETMTGKDAHKTSSLEEICKKAPKVVLKKLKLHGKDSYKVEAHGHGDLLPTEAEEDCGAVEKNMTLKAKSPHKGITVSKAEVNTPDLSLHKSPHIDTNTGNEVQTEMPGLNSAVVRCMKEKAEKENKQNRVESSVENSMNWKQRLVETENLQIIKSPRDKKKENKHKRKADEQSKTFKDATNVTQQFIQTIQSESKCDVDVMDKTSENESRSPKHKKHKREKHKEKKLKHSHKHKENVSEDELEKVAEKTENKRQEKHANKDSHRSCDLEASKGIGKEEIFSKALDEIVSAKVKEAIGGKKRKADEEHKTTDVNKEKKIKSGDKMGTSNEKRAPDKKRKHSKAEPERAHSKERKNKVKISAVSSSKQKAADKVLSALNMEARPVDVSSLGRIPKKQQMSVRKSKKDGGKTPETGTEGNELKEDSRQVAKQKKLTDSTISESKKMEHKGHVKKEHKSSELVSDRGPISADDDILPRSTMEDFMIKQEHLFKIVDSAKSSPGEPGNCLFSNVLKTKPKTGTIPGLGGVVDNTAAEDRINDYSKRQIVKSASGLKCVLSGYDPVGRVDDPQKVDIVQCLKAALHGVRAKALRMDPVAKNIHESLHGSEHTAKNKTITMSVDSEGTPSVVMKIDLSNRLPKNDDIAKDTKRTENNEQDKRSSTKDFQDKITGGSGKVAKTEKSMKNKQLCVESTNRKRTSCSDKFSKADLLIQIPEKMEVNLDEDSDVEYSETEDGVTEGVKHEAEKTDKAESLNLSFGTSLKQNLVDIHKIETEKPDDYDTLCESYAGSSSQAGPEKPDLQRNQTSFVIEVTLKDKPKQKQTEKNTTINKKTEKVEPVNVTVEIGGELTKKQSAEKGKYDLTERSSLSSKNAESCESAKEPRKTTQADDAGRHSRSKSYETAVLSSGSSSMSKSELKEKLGDSPSRRRSRSKSKSKDEIDSKASTSRSRANSESKSSRNSREKSQSKESTTTLGKSSKAGSETKDEKSAVSRSVNTSGVKSSGSHSKDDSKKEEKKSIGARLETLASKAISASELAKADSRQSRQYHPYKKEEKKKKSRKPEWSFDMAYRDMNELLQNLTTNFFRDSNKAPAQPARSVYSRSYNRRPRRFAGFVFHRSEIPKTPPRTRSPSPSADPESNKLTPDVIPDLKERQEKADLLEDIILETATGDGEEEEYSREQDIYGDEETEDNLEREDSVEREKTKNDTGDGKSDTSKSLSLPALVIPGGPKTSLFSGTQLDDTNEESRELLNGTSARPFQTEISKTVSPENEKSNQKSKFSSHRGVGLEHRTPIPDPCSSEKSPKKDCQCAKELSLHVSELEKKKSLLPDEKCLKNINSNERQVCLKEKLNNKEAGVISEPTVQSAQPTFKLTECKNVAKKNKDRLTLLSTDSDSCLDWTDEEAALDKVDETGTFLSNDELSDVGEGKSYLVVDSIGASDSDSNEDSKQEKNTENNEEITEKAGCIATNNSNPHSLVKEPSKHMNKTSSEAACSGKTRTISKEDSHTSDCKEKEKANSLKTPFVTRLNETMNESQTVVAAAGQSSCSNAVICNIDSSVKSHTSIYEEKDIHKNLNSEKLNDDYESIDTGRPFTLPGEENSAVTSESSSTLSYEEKSVNNESSVTVSEQKETLHNVMLYTKVSEETESVSYEMPQQITEKNERTTNERLPTPVNLETKNVENKKSYTPVSKENGSVCTALLDTLDSMKNRSMNNTRVYASETKEHPVAKEQAQEVYMARVRYLDDTLTKKENPLNTKLGNLNNMNNRKNDTYRAESAEEKDDLNINTIVHNIPQAVIEVEVGDSIEISDSYSNDCSNSSFVPELENANCNDCDQSKGTRTGNTEDIEENMSGDQICMVVDEAVNTDQIVLAVYEEDESGYLKEIVGVVNSGLDSPVPDESRGKEGSIAENLDQIGKNTDSEATVNQEKNDSTSPDDEKYENELVLQTAGCVNNRIADDISGHRNTDSANSCSETCNFITSEQGPVEASTDNCQHAVNASGQFLTNSSKKHTEKIEGRNLKFSQEVHSLSTVSSEIGSDALLAESQVDNAVLNVIHPAVPALPLAAPYGNSRLLDSSDSSLDIVLGSSDFESDLTDDTDILKQASRDIKQSLMDSKKKCNATLSEAKEKMGNIVGKKVMSDSNLIDPQNLVEKETFVATQNLSTCSLISVSEVSIARTVATIAPLKSVTCTASVLNPSVNSHCQVTSSHSIHIPDFLPSSASSEQGLLPNPFINSPLMSPTSRFMSGLEQFRLNADGVNAMTYFRPPFQSYMYNMNRSFSATSPVFRGFIPQTTSAFDIPGWQNYQLHYPSSDVQEMQQYNFSPSQLQPWMFSFRFSPNFSPPNPNTYFSSVYANTPPFTNSYNYSSSSRFSSNHAHNGRFDRSRCFSNLIELTSNNSENVMVTETAEHKKDEMECFNKRSEVLEDNYQHESATGSSWNRTIAVKSNIRLSQTDTEAGDHVSDKTEAEPEMAVEFRDSRSVSYAGLQEDCCYDKDVKCRDKQEETILISDNCDEKIKVGSSKHEFLCRNSPSLVLGEKMKNTAASDEIDVKSASFKEPSKMRTHGPSMLHTDYQDADIKDCQKALKAKRKELQNKCVKSDSSQNLLMPSEKEVDAESYDKSRNKYNVDDSKIDTKDKHSGEELNCEKVFSDKDGKYLIICDVEKSQFSADNAKSSSLNPEERNTSEKHKPQANSGEPVKLLIPERHTGSQSKIGAYSREQNTADTSGVKSISSSDARVKPDLILKTTKVTESSLVPHVIQSSKSEVIEQEIKEFYNSLGSMLLTDYSNECQKDIDVKTKTSKEAVTESFSNACDIEENNEDRSKSVLETYSKVNKDCSERDESQNSTIGSSIIYRELRTEEKSTVCDSRTLEGEVVKHSLPCARNNTTCSNALTSIQVKEKTEIVDTDISKEIKEKNNKLKACAVQSETSDELAVVNLSIKCPSSSTGVKDILNKPQQKHTSSSLNLVDSKDNQDENRISSEHDSVMATQNGINDSIPVGAFLQKTCQKECNLSECYVWNGEVIPFSKTDICDKVKSGDKNTSDKSYVDKISSTDSDRDQADQMSVPDVSNRQSDDLVITNKSAHLEESVSKFSESFDNTSCHAKSGIVSHGAICKHKSAVTDSAVGNIFDCQSKVVQTKTSQKVMKKKKKTGMKKEVVGISNKKKKTNKIDLDKEVVSFYKELGIAQANTKVAKDLKNESVSSAKQGLEKYNRDDKSGKNTLLDKSAMYTSRVRLVAYDDDQNEDDDSEIMEVSGDKNSQSNSKADESAKHKHNQCLIKEPETEKIEQSTLILRKSTYEDSNRLTIAGPFNKQTDNAYQDSCNREEIKKELTSDIGECKSRIIQIAQPEEKQNSNTFSSLKALPSVDNLTNNSKSDSKIENYKDRNKSDLETYSKESKDSSERDESPNSNDDGNFIYRELRTEEKSTVCDNKTVEGEFENYTLPCARNDTACCNALTSTQVKEKTEIVDTDIRKEIKENSSKLKACAEQSETSDELAVVKSSIKCPSSSTGVKDFVNKSQQKHTSSSLNLVDSKDSQDENRRNSEHDSVLATQNETIDSISVGASLPKACKNECNLSECYIWNGEIIPLNKTDICDKVESGDKITSNKSFVDKISSTDSVRVQADQMSVFDASNRQSDDLVTNKSAHLDESISESSESFDNTSCHAKSGIVSHGANCKHRSAVTDSSVGNIFDCQSKVVQTKTSQKVMKKKKKTGMKKEVVDISNKKKKTNKIDLDKAVMSFYKELGIAQPNTNVAKDLKNVSVSSAKQCLVNYNGDGKLGKNTLLDKSAMHTSLERLVAYDDDQNEDDDSKIMMVSSDKNGQSTSRADESAKHKHNQCLIKEPETKKIEQPTLKLRESTYEEGNGPTMAGPSNKQTDNAYKETCIGIQKEEIEKELTSDIDECKRRSIQKGQSDEKQMSNTMSSFKALPSIKYLTNDSRMHSQKENNKDRNKSDLETYSKANKHRSERDESQNSKDDGSFTFRELRTEENTNVAKDLKNVSVSSAKQCLMNYNGNDKSGKATLLDKSAMHTSLECLVAYDDDQTEEDDSEIIEVSGDKNSQSNFKADESAKHKHNQCLKKESETEKIEQSTLKLRESTYEEGNGPTMVGPFNKQTDNTYKETCIGINREDIEKELTSDIDECKSRSIQKALSEEKQNSNTMSSFKALPSIDNLTNNSRSDSKRENNKDRNKSDLETYSEENKDRSEGDESQNSKDDGSFICRELRTEEKSTLCGRRSLEGEYEIYILPCARNDTACCKAFTSTQVKEKTEIVDTDIRKEIKENSSKLKACAEQSETSDELAVVKSSIKCPSSSTGVKDFVNKSQQDHISSSLNLVDSKDSQDENRRYSEHDSVMATHNGTIDGIPVGASLPKTCKNECNLSECYVWNGEIIPINKTDICDKVESDDKNTSDKSYVDKISSTDSDRVQAYQVSVSDVPNKQSDDLLTHKSAHLDESVSESSKSFDNASCHAKSGYVSICKHKSAVTDSSVGNIFDCQNKVVQTKTSQKVMKKKKKTGMKKEVVDISHKKKKKNKIDLDKAVVSFYKELGIAPANTNVVKDLKNVSVSSAKQCLVNYNGDDKSGKNTLLDKSAMHTSLECLVAYDDDQTEDDNSEIMVVSSDKNGQSNSKADESAKHKHNQCLIKEPETKKIEQSTLKLRESTYEEGNGPTMVGPFNKQTDNMYKETCIGINKEEMDIELTSDIDECKSRSIQKAQSEEKQMSNTMSSFKALPSIDNLTNNSRSDSPRLSQVDPAEQFSHLKYKQTGIGVKTKAEPGTNKIKESDFIKEENDKGKEVLSSSLAYSEQIVLSVEDTTQSCEGDKYHNLFPNETSDCTTGIIVSEQKCADADIHNPEASTTGFEKSLLDSDGSYRLVTDEAIESWDTISRAALTREQETLSSKTGTSSISLLCSAYSESSNESLMNTQNSSTVPKGFQDSLAVFRSYISEDSDSSDSHLVVSTRPNSNDDDLESRHADSISSSSEITESDIGCQADISTEKMSSPTYMQNKMVRSEHMLQKERKEKDLCNDEMNSYLRCKWIQDDIQSPDSSNTESICDSPCSDPDTVKAVSDSDELYQSDTAEQPQPGQSLGNISTDDYTTEDIKPSMMSTKTAECNIIERPESKIGILNQSFQSQSDASDITNVLEPSFLDSPMSNMSSLSLNKLEEKRKRLTNILLRNTTNSSLMTESGECSDSDNSKASAVSNKQAQIQSWIQRGAEEKLISRLMLSEKLQEGWDSSSSDDESFDVHTRNRSKQFVILDSFSCSDKDLKCTNDLSDAVSVRSSSDSQFYGKRSSPFQKAIQNSSSSKSCYTRKRTLSSRSHEKSGKSRDKIDSENYERWSVRQRSKSGSIASDISHQDKRNVLELDWFGSRNRHRSSSKDSVSSHRSRESSRSSDFRPYSGSSSREVFSSSSCDREQSHRRYSPNRESRRIRHHKASSGTRKKFYSRKEQHSEGHRRSGNRSDSSESCFRWKNRPRSQSSSSGISELPSDTNNGRLRHSSRSRNEIYTSSKEMWRIEPETEAENFISELPVAYQDDARRHEISQSSAGRGAAKWPVERRIDIRHRTSSPIYGDENKHGDVGALNQKEKVVILHSSTLASENLGDIQELIKSLAQYTTSRCHWKALVHSRMICDLDEWRSVNPDCSKLLELMSAYRDMDHVELLPFHGCDEVRMRPDRCAEQIAAERSNVVMTFLIAEESSQLADITGSRVGIQRTNQPGRPRVSTENPIAQLHALKKGIMYEEAHRTISNQFSVSVTISGKPFQGSGKTKREAKQAAAKAALIERFNVLTVPSAGILSTTDPCVVICSIEEFMELHLTSKNT